MARLIFKARFAALHKGPLAARRLHGATRRLLISGRGPLHVIYDHHLHWYFPVLQPEPDIRLQSAEDIGQRLCRRVRTGYEQQKAKQSLQPPFERSVTHRFL